MQRRLTAEASSQLHALGDRAHEEMVGTRVPSARGDILVGDGFGMCRRIASFKSLLGTLPVRSSGWNKEAAGRPTRSFGVYPRSAVHAGET